MDVRAMILVGVPAEVAAEPSEGNLALLQPSSPRHASPAETIGGVPIALLDVVGKPLVHRLADQLHAAGISSVAVISNTCSDAAALVRHAKRPDLDWTEANGEQFWRACLQTFSDLAHAGAEVVLVFRLGPYLELNFDELLTFHLDQKNRVTCVVAPDGSGAGVFAISASRRNDAAYLFRHELRQCRASAAEYVFDGYLNRLRHAADLRQLATDAFYNDLRIKPAGRQIKPGVWVAEGARIHPRARVLAPAFIGARARVRAAAVITRGTSVEHHAEVDCGTVVEDSSILSFSYVGPGLDVAHSVVGFRRLAHLTREVEVEIGDAKLISVASTRAPVRALSSAVGLASFLPVQMFRGLFAKSHRKRPTELPASVHAPAGALQTPPEFEESAETEAEKFPANLIVAARRYGNE